MVQLTTAYPTADPVQGFNESQLGLDILCLFFLLGVTVPDLKDLVLLGGLGEGVVKLAS